MSLQKKKFEYKYVILVICFLMEFICLGFCSSNAGLYLTAITKALNFDRTLYSLTYSVRYVVSTVVALFFGFLTGKVGVKKMAIVGMLSLVCSTTIFSFADTLPMFYLGGAFWGLGVTFCGGTMAGTIVRRWFDKDVGKFTGIVMSANGIGGAIAAQIITPMINEIGNPFGYRNAYRLAAAISLVVCILVIILLRDKQDQAPGVGAVKKKQRGVVWTGIEFKDLVKKPFFYFVALMVALTGISLQAIGSVTSAYLFDLGFTSQFVALTATVGSVVLTCSKIIVGASYDKKGLRFTLLMCHAATMLTFVLKALLANSPVGQVMAVIATCFASIAQPIETVMLPLMANDLFGRAGYTKGLGILMAMNSAGLCLGSPIGNLFYTLFGTYLPALWLFAGIMLVVMIGFQFVITSAYKEKDRILAAETK